MAPSSLSIRGYLYIALAEDGIVKIGVSQSPTKRLRQVSTSSGRRFSRVFQSHELADPYQLEKIIHRHFDYAREPGEWFHINFDEAIEVAHRTGAMGAPLEWRQSERFTRGCIQRAKYINLLSVPNLSLDMIVGFFQAFDKEHIADSLYVEYCHLAIFAKHLKEIHAVLSRAGLDADAILNIGLQKSSIQQAIDRLALMAGETETKP